MNTKRGNLGGDPEWAREGGKWVASAGQSLGGRHIQKQSTPWQGIATQGYLPETGHARGTECRQSRPSFPCQVAGQRHSRVDGLHLGEHALLGAVLVNPDVQNLGLVVHVVGHIAVEGVVTWES